MPLILNPLAALASAGYLLLVAWAFLLARREPVGSSSQPWIFLGLAGLASCCWAALLATGPRVELEAFAQWADWVRQLAWMAWLFHVLGLGRARRGHWAVLGWVVGGGLLLSGLLLAAQQLHWLDRGLRALTPLYSGLGLAVLGLVLLEQLYRNAGQDERWNVKPLCLGLAAMYGFDLYLFAEGLLLNDPDEAVFGLRPIVHALGLPLLLLGAARGKGVQSRLSLSRDAAFHSVALLLAGVYLLLVAALGYWLRFTGGVWGPALQLLLIVAAVLLLGMVLASGSMRARLRVWLAKHFLRYRYDYRQEWQRFTAALTEQAHGGDAAEAVLRALADLVESPGGGLWRQDGSAYVQVVRWNFDRQAQREALDSRFVAELEEKRWIADLNAERRAPSHALPLPEWLLADPQAWLVIPLLANGRLQAWVVLAQPRTPFPLNWEVLDLLRGAASQAAGYLAMLQASSQLMEARKFEAFNRMSAFVVHDLKNIVTQLSLMLKNAERHGDNPEFRADMLETVDHAVEKMRLLMAQLREGESPAGGTSGVALDALAERLRAQAAQRGRVLNLDIVEALATRGHEARVERVIGHAVQNAFDASGEEQAVLLRLSRLGSYAKLEVIDSGCGMSADFIRERLFKPFQSTKAHGMGIGAYESLQTVQELGGKMEVDSEPGRGTTISFLLPLLHTRTSEA